MNPPLAITCLNCLQTSTGDGGFGKTLLKKIRGSGISTGIPPLLDFVENNSTISVGVNLVIGGVGWRNSGTGLLSKSGNNDAGINLD